MRDIHKKNIIEIQGKGIYIEKRVMTMEFKGDYWEKEEELPQEENSNNAVPWKLKRNTEF